jgi:FkbM family methyltransferase
MPLVHCAAALTKQNLTVIDVGANVGDSAVLLETYLPGQCKFVCVEPNSDWIPYLQSNTAGLPVEIITCFVGEGQLLAVRSTVPGTAGSVVSKSGHRSHSLDEICEGRKVDFLKIDTDGFDFPIIRSGRQTLSSLKPALFFEWDPVLWREQGEEPEAIFDWLLEYGYSDFCFFADGGFLYCRVTLSQAETIRSLVAAADCRHGIDNLYWDVFASSPEICDRAIRNNTTAAQTLSREVRVWNRLQPTFWR